MNKHLLTSLLALASVVELRDPYTGGHSWRVGNFARMLARKAGLNETLAFEAGIGGFLHDLGKIGVPDAVLRNPGKLTADEYALMKTHPTMGAELLHDHPLAHAAVDAVLSHHERPDGNGYPNRLDDDTTPIVGRLVAIADSFDAMTSSRSYRAGMPIERALAILREERGRQFDATFTDAFVSLHESKNALVHIVGFSDHDRPLQTCTQCGPIIAVPRATGDGETIYCRNCGRAYRLHAAGPTFELEPAGQAPDSSVLRPIPETDVFAEFIDAPRPKGRFFLGRLAEFAAGRT